MPRFKSHGLRGSILEDNINNTLTKYEDSNLCLIRKVPTPIKPVELSADHTQITLAYFEKKSSVDYIGVVQGIPICFDVKECAKTTFPMLNIHKHQFEFMKKMEMQKGISFIIIYFSSQNEYYYLTFKELEYFWDRKEKNIKKSFKIDELDKNHFFAEKDGIIPILDMIQLDLDERL